MGLGVLSGARRLHDQPSNSRCDDVLISSPTRLVYSPSERLQRETQHTRANIENTSFKDFLQTDLVTDLMLLLLVDVSDVTGGVWCVTDSVWCLSWAGAGPGRAAAGLSRVTTSLSRPSASQLGAGNRSRSAGRGNWGTDARWDTGSVQSPSLRNVMG